MLSVNFTGHNFLLWAPYMHIHRVGFCVITVSVVAGLQATVVMFLGILVENADRVWKDNSPNDYKHSWLPLIKALVFMYPLVTLIVMVCLVLEITIKKFMYYRLLSLRILIDWENYMVGACWIAFRCAASLPSITCMRISLCNCVLHVLTHTPQYHTACNHWFPRPLHAHADLARNILLLLHRHVDNAERLGPVRRDCVLGPQQHQGSGCSVLVHVHRGEPADTAAADPVLPYHDRREAPCVSERGA